jgi:hypothetical protein
VWPADNVFGTEDTTEMVYDKVGRVIVNDVVGGYNGTLFCYGQAPSITPAYTARAPSSSTLAP